MLEIAELTLDRRPTAVQVAEPLGLARDQWMQPVSLASHRLGFAFPGRTAPLGCLAFVVGTSELPFAMNTMRRFGKAALDARRFAKRNDRGDVAFSAPVVDEFAVV